MLIMSLDFQVINVRFIKSANKPIPFYDILTRKNRSVDVRPVEQL